MVFMRLLKVVIGEIIILLASVLIFRSFWTLLDQYLGYSNLELMLIIGVIVAVLGLILLNYEVKNELAKNSKTTA